MSSQQVNFSETTVDKLIRYLKDWDNNRFFEKFFYGDDIDLIVGSDQLPCIIVDLTDSTFDQGPTGRDKVTETIKINLVFSRKEYIDEFDDGTVSWKKKAELLIQGNDPTTGQYDPTTILGILRTNFTLGNYATNQAIKVKYGVTARTNEGTGEATVTIIVDRFQDTPNKT